MKATECPIEDRDEIIIIQIQVSQNCQLTKRVVFDFRYSIAFQIFNKRLN
jgi:hypothetical protein